MRIKFVASETLIAEEQQKLEGYKLELKKWQVHKKILKNYFKKLIMMFNSVKITSVKKSTRYEKPIMETLRAIFTFMNNKSKKVCNSS